MRILPSFIIQISLLVFSQAACLQKAKEQSEPPASEESGNQLRTFGHFAPPCAACHNEDRPAEPHEASADCQGCHKYSDWSAPAASFNHNPAPSQCNACHNDDRPPEPHVASGDCVSCHSFPSFDPNET